ncbi:DUF4245 domain-containing protein [Solihabitans fulvus]|uniref:DUF4245 domain-containing protein n=1 Tax=Solihabitans fulvus TaxID=1892852 RepID=A0A5B2XLJ4_9PSEU|nr:DUF4245 domain-containing protein [Solihabitans fulvus]KAA2263995.1 DUF4245 domain-containing protein [Solihabitans fulvus]
MAKTARDMVLSLVALIVVLIALGSLGRGCAFSPGGPKVDPKAVPTVDQHAELRDAAGIVGFPVRDPNAPAGWRVNSAQTAATPSGASSVQVGWLTAGGRYLRLAQSSAPLDELVRFEGGLDRNAAVPADGSLQVAGRTWTGYPGQHDERAWATDLDGVRVLITGSGTQDEVRALASAVQDSTVLPSTR